MVGPDDMCIEAPLASACAPLVFQAVQIGEDFHWDGSYGGNPMLWPRYGGQREADVCGR